MHANVDVGNVAVSLSGSDVYMWLLFAGCACTCIKVYVYTLWMQTVYIFVNS